MLRREIDGVLMRWEGRAGGFVGMFGIFAEDMAWI